MCSSEWPNKGLDGKQGGLNRKDNRWSNGLFSWNLIGSQPRRKKTKRRQKDMIEGITGKNCIFKMVIEVFENPFVMKQ